MMLFRTSRGAEVEWNGERRRIEVPTGFGALLRRDDLRTHLERAFARAEPVGAPGEPLSPLGDRQEVWAAGVTYLRSRDARIEEADAAGGGDFYDRVYRAKRPELFFKATARRVAGPGQPVRIRGDSEWNVPEPELALVVSPTGRILGYTAGNDVSSRSIEGENPLYLPQAKVYDQCCSLGPGILVRDAPLAPETGIRMMVRRGDRVAFRGATTLARMRRRPDELIGYLFADQSHPDGVILLTGTGIVPGEDFTLEPGDRVFIEIDGIGTLCNPVVRGQKETA